MQIYTTEKLSPHKEMTPEGFLLCRDVVISRAGTFDYKPSDVGLIGRNGVVKMTRTPEELFSRDTMASFEGKDVTIGHGGWIDSTNWAEKSIGQVSNVRRVGDNLVADLLIKSKDGIAKIQSGELEEVSCGYDAEAIQDADGYGHQRGIVGNHLAFVDKARCGSACRVRDGFMKDDKEPTIFSRLVALFKKGDEDEFKEALQEVVPMEDSDLESLGVELSEKEGGEGEVKEEEVKERVEDVDDVPPVNANDSIEGRISVLEHEYQEMAQKLAKLLDVEKAEGHEELKDEADVDRADEGDTNSLEASIEKLENIVNGMRAALGKKKDAIEDEDDTEEETKAEAEEKKADAEEDEYDEVVSDDEVKEVFADADTICEGLKKPVGDAKFGRFSRGLINHVKRSAIKGSGYTQFGDSATLEGRALDTAFKACVALRRNERNPRIQTSDAASVGKRNLNEINSTFWSNY